MSYQIDQSGKIEDTSKKTVIACSNGNSKTVLLAAKEKRRLQDKFRLVGATQIFIDTTFAVLVFMLIKLLKTQVSFNIDIEYPGHTRIIEDMIGRLSAKELTIKWTLVGKSSPAHDLAYKTFKNKALANKKIMAEEVWEFAMKASQFLSKLKAGGYLNSTTLRENRYSAPANINTISKRAKKVNKKLKRI